MAAAKPWMKFYPRDWRADEKLRDCSLAARGLWIEMLAIMHASERYGRLLVNGKVPSTVSLARQVGAATDEIDPLLDELREAGVFSTDANGIIYSRRMKSDEKLVENARKNGKRGGNPKLCDKTINPAPDKGEDNGGDKDGLKLRGQSPDTLPNGNGEIADPDKIFWANSKALMQPFCKGDPGKVIGAWLRDHGKDLTIAALTAAQLEDAVNPIEYCQGYFRRHRADRKPNGRSDPASPGNYLDYLIEQKAEREAYEARQAAAAGGG